MYKTCFLAFDIKFYRRKPKAMTAEELLEHMKESIDKMRAYGYT